MHYKTEIAVESLFIALDAYPKALGVELPQAMRRSFRILIQRIMAWTPPTSGKRASNMADAEKAGAAAIRRDIMKLVFIEKREVLDFWQEQNYGRPRINSMTLKKKGSNETYTLRDLIIDPDAAQLDALHTRMRNRRGTISPRYRGERLAVTLEAFSKFLEKQLSHSGLAKSGWLPAFAHFGGQSPAWIARHGLGQGAFVDNIASSLFTLEATNSAKSIGSLAPRLIYSSINAQAKATIRELEKAADSAAFRSKLIKQIGAA